MSLIPLDCPSCGANLTVDSNKDAAICEYCGKPYIVKDAIVHNYINNVTNITADTVNVYSEKDFVIKAGVLEKYNGESVDVVIPDNVKTIGEHAFAGLAIETVVIPENVNCIQAGAFEDCESLINFTVHSNGVVYESVSVDGSISGVFQGAKSLKKVSISQGVIKISKYTFYGCEGLQIIEMPDSLKEIEYCAFENCKSLVCVEIPDSVEHIGLRCFSRCLNLKKVHIPAGITEIAHSCFLDCVNLQEIEIPDSVEKIGESAFEGCHNPLILKTSIGTFEVNPDELSDTSVGEVKQKYWMKQNKCTSCGGDFIGLIIKKCTNCGKKKDY